MLIGSLFSGIGGLELGLERAGLGRTVWQVEANAYCRSVLAKHWPKAKRYEDVRSVGSATLASVDLICGGFPCQDVSSAGKRAGITGNRSGLWKEYRRIVAELRPRWVVVENVASGARAWVDTVVADLARLGYACLPIPLAASDVGAPHHRARVFIVAVTDADGESEPARTRAASRANVADVEREQLRQQSGRRSGSSRRRAPIAARHGGAALWGGQIEPDVVRVADGLPADVDASARIRALGNAVVPQCAEVIGHVIRQLQ